MLSNRTATAIPVDAGTASFIRVITDSPFSLPMVVSTFESQGIGRSMSSSFVRAFPRLKLTTFAGMTFID